MTQEENHHEQGQDAEEEADHLQVCIGYLSEGQAKENVSLHGGGGGGVANKSSTLQEVLAADRCSTLDLVPRVD